MEIKNVCNVWKYGCMRGNFGTILANLVSYFRQFGKVIFELLFIQSNCTVMRGQRPEVMKRNTHTSSSCEISGERLSEVS